eukprot:TRINITY_DN3988_c0_g1_i1.p1 TRINITY_DN3988_c0_g1~~TRINITY_DN3988_c0_g1_i1.p1  ORF type:complete len:384 (+),score=141.32 TRINITY_DN3988_c0_g1_i1:139-1290(+)
MGPPKLKVSLDKEIEEQVMNAQDVYMSVGGTSLHAGNVVVTASGTNTQSSQYNMLNLRRKDLDIMGTLGVGSSGCVRKALHKPTNKTVALKEIKLVGRHLDEIGNEFKTLYREGNSCPYVIEFVGAYLEEGSVILALEYMDGSLLDMLNPAAPEPEDRGVPEDILACVTKMVLKGLDYLHCSTRLVHRDLKPSNLLFNNDGTVKITDFGVSHTLESTMGDAASFVGTLTYMSPERLNGKPYGFPVDIWGLGVTLVELATCDHPYKAIGAEEACSQGRFWKLINHLQSDVPPCDIPDDCSQDFRDFIALCLAKEPEKRVSAKKLLNHPWVEDNTQPDDQLDQAKVAEWLERRQMAKSATEAEQPATGGLDEEALRTAIDNILFQ